MSSSPNKRRHNKQHPLQPSGIAAKLCKISPANVTERLCFAAAADEHVSAQKTAPIGIFVDEAHPQTLQKCQCHIMHVVLLGKHLCIATRKAARGSRRNGLISTQRDCTNHLAAECETQSKHLGHELICSTEKVTIRCDLENRMRHRFHLD